MMQLPSILACRDARKRGTPLTWVGCGVLAVFVCGCTSLTLPNAPGHVVITLVNRATVDEQLLNFLRPRLPDLNETEIEALRPRIRMNVRITYTDGSSLVERFVSGSSDLIDPAAGAESFTDLNQSDFTTFVAVCDVASVEVDPGTDIEVFIPVALQQFQLVETTGPGGEVNPTFQPRDRIAPQFRPLRIDDLDEDGDVILRRNIDVLDAPGPVPEVICGSVVAIVVDGVLAVPFLPQSPNNEPSFDVDDEGTEARIGGRYEFIVQVQ